LGTIERKDPRFDALVPKGGSTRDPGRRLCWTEGPVWDKAGSIVLFSDIPREHHQRVEREGGIKVFAKPSGYTGRSFHRP
jgi:gluconolactonase